MRKTFKNISDALSQYNQLKFNELTLKTIVVITNIEENKINGVKLKNSNDDDSKLILSAPINDTVKINKYDII